MLSTLHLSVPQTSSDDDSDRGFAPQCPSCLTMLVENSSRSFAHWSCASCGHIRIS